MSFLDEYCNYACEITDSPRNMQYYTALSVLSTIINTNIYIKKGIKDVYPNLWMILVAPSSFYRKSYTLSIAEDLIREVDEELVFPREFSPEAFLEILQEKSKGVFISYEFKTLIDIMDRSYMSGMKSMLTELYDCPYVYDRKIKDKEIVIRNPFLNILSASTLNWLENTICEEDVLGGLIPRFLIVTATKKDKIIPIQPTYDKIKRDQLVSFLRRVMDIKGEMMLEPEAREYYCQWYINHEKFCSDSFVSISPFLSRLSDYALKFSMISAVESRLSLLITKQDCVFGCKIADYFSRNIIRIFDEEISMNPKERERRKIEKIIRDHSKEISKELLLRKTRILIKDLNPILDTLVQSNKVEKKSDRVYTTRGNYVTKETYQWKEIFSEDGNWLK